MTEVVGMLVLQDMDLPAKEIDFSLLFAEIGGHVVVELPQARSVSGCGGSIKRRHTTINSGGWSSAKRGCGDRAHGSSCAKRGGHGG